VARPEEANEPAAACAIFATYFYTHHDLEAANAGDWKRVRKTVNGGLNGWLKFFSYVEQLEAAVAQTSAELPAAAGGAVQKAGV
jgi:predicted chitinase